VFAFVIGSMLSCATPVERRELAEEYFNLGNAYFELQDYERSYQYYRRAIALTDTVPAAGFNLARLHLERGEESRALEVLDQLLLSNPSNLLVLETRAYVLYRLGAADQAREQYRDILERSAAHTRAAYNLGVLEIEEGEYVRAAAVLTEYLPHAREDGEYRWLLAEALFLSGHEEEALRELDHFRAIVRDDRDELERLAARYADWEYYLATLEVIDLLPEESLRRVTPAWAQARALLLGSEEFDDGASALERALEAGFQDAEALNELLSRLPLDEQELLQELIDRFEHPEAEDPPAGGDPPEAEELPESE
jgi:tetratricopeptide (TPR) repeat protein